MGSGLLPRFQRRQGGVIGNLDLAFLRGVRPGDLVVGGIVGCICTGIFATKVWNPAGVDGEGGPGIHFPVT